MLDKNSPRAKVITSAIARMMIVDCQPFSMVSDTGFQQLMKVVEPMYSIPRRATFAEEMIPDIYRAERKKIQDVISEDVKTVRIISYVRLVEKLHLDTTG